MARRAAADPRDAFLARNLSRHKSDLPKGAVDDLRHFRKRITETGLPMTWTALAQWMLEHHGVQMGRQRMHTLAVENGIEPWWSK